MKQPKTTDAQTHGGNPFVRGDALWRCLERVASYFESQLAIPAHHVYSAPFTFGALASFGIITASRLLTLKPAPDWDPLIARNHLDLASCLSRLANQLEQAEALACRSGRTPRLVQDDTTCIGRYVSRLRWIQKWYSSKVLGNEWPSLGQINCQSDEEQALPTAAPAANDFSHDLDLSIDHTFWDGFLVPMDPSWMAMPLDESMTQVHAATHTPG